MKLFVNEKNCWFQERFEVLDEEGKIYYTSWKKGWGPRHILHIYDANEKEVVTIDQKSLGLSSEFHINNKGELYKMVVPKKTWGKESFEVPFLGWKIEGNWWNNKYNVYQGNKLLASISCNSKGSNDSYEVTISNPEDEIYVITLVFAMNGANAYMGNRCAIAK